MHPRAQADQEARVSQLATLRHDLRTPINAIIGYSEMLLEDAPEEQETGVGQVHALGKDLLKRINALLSVPDEGAELEALAHTLERELAEPLSILMATCAALLDEARRQNDNARQADLEKISTAATRLSGLVHSAASPAALAASDQPAAVKKMGEVLQSIQEDPRQAVPPGTILIVDDSEMNRDVLARYLERHGHRSLAAKSGQEALAMITADAFDLMLLDIMMPEMNGFEVLQRVKRDPGLRDLPVIMISAIDEVESVVRCIEMGAEDYLPKPFDPILLGARIGACLEKKRLRDQEVAYLRSVEQVISAASAVEAGSFEAGILGEVAERKDALGQLARVFTRMAHEVIVREQRLKQQVQQLKVEVDAAKMAHQVAEITESDFFQDLQKKVQTMRSRHEKTRP